MTRVTRCLAWLSAVAIGLWGLAAGPAGAQTEFPPPSGKGRVVIVLSGNSGTEHYNYEARYTAQLGYDVVLLDGNRFAYGHGDRLHDAIVAAQHSEHALPGKVAVVGYSLGGGVSLAWATRWSDVVAAVIAWYPMSRFVKDPDAVVDQVKVPTLIFAGEDDSWRGTTWMYSEDEMYDVHGCCWIKRVQAVAAAAAARGAPLQLVAYPHTDHHFDNRDFNGFPRAADDAWQREASRLKQALAD